MPKTAHKITNNQQVKQHGVMGEQLNHEIDLIWRSLNNSLSLHYVATLPIITQEFEPHKSELE